MEVFFFLGIGQRKKISVGLQTYNHPISLFVSLCIIYCCCFWRDELLSTGFTLEQIQYNCDIYSSNKQHLTTMFQEVLFTCCCCCSQNCRCFFSLSFCVLLLLLVSCFFFRCWPHSCKFRYFLHHINDLNELEDKAKNANSGYKWIKENWKKIFVIIVTIFALIVVVGIYRRCFSDSG